MTAEFSLAVHALVYLSAQNRELTSEELAENICTNSARVRKIMHSLKAAGLVTTKEGIGGGYTLNVPDSSISLRRIAEAAGTDFVKAGWRSGNVDMDCAVASGIAGVMDGIYGDLNSSCLNMLSQITVADIRKKLTAAKKEKKSEKS